MAKLRRRSILRHGAVSGAAVLAGCLGENSDAITDSDGPADGCKSEEIVSNWPDPAPPENGFPSITASAAVSANSEDLDAADSVFDRSRLTRLPNFASPWRTSATNR